MKVLITAGPTREKIDDVRYISNYSSGKMGYALADIAFELNYDVTLISGLVNISPKHNYHIEFIESADEMHQQVLKYYQDMDILIFAAAVADFKPLNYHQGKIKKQIGEQIISLELIKNPDILADIASRKSDNQFVVGFALEAENEINNAISKLTSKNCDLIILNSSNKQDSGFNGDNNTITIIDKKHNILTFPPMTKVECAKTIFTEISKIKKV
ncbi:MAG TPA: phosphopantothenoylcysteine decarboxylase [Candidatus Kapabacteria bacterium]|nr:phosphopantothenoylcysteine decarboxylase [Candidatus Kapabacteria bacterium]